MKRNRFSFPQTHLGRCHRTGRLATGLAESGGKLEDGLLGNAARRTRRQAVADGAEDDLNARSTACSTRTRRRTTHWPTSSKPRRILRDVAPGAGFRHPAVQCAGARLVTLLDPRRHRSPRSTLQPLKVRISAPMSSRRTQLALADYLYSPDQLPRSFVDTWH
jgi:hypothetical protein